MDVANKDLSQSLVIRKAILYKKKMPIRLHRNVHKRKTHGEVQAVTFMKKATTYSWIGKSTAVIVEEEASSHQLGNCLLYIMVSGWKRSKWLSRKPKAKA